MPVHRPSPVRWRRGSLGVAVTWQRVAIDVMHHRGRNYLSVIDVPSRFCVWRELCRVDAVEITSHLEQLFLERGTRRNCLRTMTQCSGPAGGGPRGAVEHHYAVGS